VVAARTLEEGAAWIEARLGVATVSGGKHALMGTHNRLLSLGPGRFLEVIAIDPDAPPIARPRWFDLDSPAMRERLARGPALIHWVERTDDLETALHGYPDRIEILSLSRGPYRWRIGVRPDGQRPAGGTLPTLIQWKGDLHPAGALPDSGLRLGRLEPLNDRVAATLSTPSGVRTIS
jgi:hypothetical protein